MTRPVVTLNDVGVTFHSGGVTGRTSHPAVNGVSLEIGRGEILGLVGESGSGKSTLGKVCLGLVPPTVGSVEILGEPARRRRRSHRGKLGVVMQNPLNALNPRMRAADAVAEFCVAGGDTANRVKEMFGLVGLDFSLGERYPHELSGGQCQRVAVARALVNKPDFVVFDEAVSALDVSVQLQILNVIKDAQEATDFSALFISHDIGAVRYVCDRIAVLRSGELLEIGPAARFYGQPEHEYSRQLLAASHL